MQGVGLAYYYRQVGQIVFARRACFSTDGVLCWTSDLGPSQCGWPLCREGTCCDVQGLRLYVVVTHKHFLSGKGRACFAWREGVLQAGIDCSVETCRSVVRYADSSELSVLLRVDLRMLLDVIDCLSRKDCLKRGLVAAQANARRKHAVVEKGRYCAALDWAPVGVGKVGL